MDHERLWLRISVAVLIAFTTLAWAQPDAGDSGYSYRSGEVLVKFNNAAEEWRKKRARRMVNGLKVHPFRTTGIEKIHIGRGMDTRRAIELLQDDPMVDFAEPNWEVEYLGMPTDPPDDPGFTSGDQWYLDAAPFSEYFLTPGSSIQVDVDLDAPEAWGVMAAVFDTGMTAAVGVLDSGCGEDGYFDENMGGYVTGHVDLPNSVLFANTAELSFIGSDSPADANDLIDDVNGWDWVEGDNVPADPAGKMPYHGTRISGIIAARWGNGTDVAGIGKGHLSVLPLRSNTVAEILEGIEYAIEMAQAGVPVRVLNASWKLSIDSHSLRLALEKAGDARIALVAAAGNSGSDNDDMSRRVFPAEYTKVPLTNVLAVAATGTDGALASFSNFGPSSVQIAAPGENIYSTAGGAGGYTSESGTSFSAPIAASALGILMAALPDLTPEQAIIRLTNGGDFDHRLAGMISSGKRVNLAGTLAPFYPYSGLVLLDSSPQPVYMYTDSMSSLYGTITQVTGSDDSVAVMATDSSGAWMVSGISPGVASFTLSFDGAAAPVGSYETGPWRVTAITPFTARARAGETLETPFLSLLQGTSVSWSVTDPRIGEIDENGWFTGRNSGFTRVVLSIDGTPVDISGNIRVLPPYSSPSESSGDSGGCFIATAAYGTDMADDVILLRRFRDEVLLGNAAGRVFVHAYYKYSPPVADFIRDHEPMKTAVRVLLKPLIWTAGQMLEETE